MTAYETVREIQSLGGRLEARGERLYVDVPVGVLTTAHREALRRHKREILVLVQPTLQDKATIGSGHRHRDDMDYWKSLPLQALKEMDVGSPVAIRIECVGETMWLVSGPNGATAVDVPGVVYEAIEAIEI